MLATTRNWFYTVRALHDLVLYQLYLAGRCNLHHLMHKPRSGQAAAPTVQPQWVSGAAEAGAGAGKGVLQQLELGRIALRPRQQQR